MKISQTNLNWMLDSDPALRWQVERDLANAPAEVWQATRARVATEGFGARLLALQDADGQWAGGAYFPGRNDDRVTTHPDDDQGQPYFATTWTLNALREWGVSGERLAGTAEKLERNSRWEYENLPYWGGEVDACINGFTLANGAWLGADVSALAQWFPDHQLDDGGWNCEWVEGSVRSSFHSTLNALKGILSYEQMHGREPHLTAARHRAQEYLLSRHLLTRLSSGEEVGPWVHNLAYPFRWVYTALNALVYLCEASEFDGCSPDDRASDAIKLVCESADPNGRWVTTHRYRGATWFDVDGDPGTESKWLTFFATRVMLWWDEAHTLSS